jgi:hypothetical protein
MRIRIVLAALFALVSTAALAAGSSVGYEMGGPYARFEPVVDQYNRSGELFRIDGHCQSSCTLFLGIRNVCIGPGAEFFFHSPHDNLRNPSPYYLKLFLPHYNGRLRAYLLAHHALEKVDPFYPISGNDMIHQFGYRACPPA